MQTWYKSPKYQMVMRLFLITAVLFCSLASIASRSHALEMRKSGYIGSFKSESPMSLASDGRERLFIGGMWGRITVTDLEGNKLYSFGGQGSELEGKILEPSGMYYYGGRLYIADSWYGHVVVLTPEGKLVDIYGRSGRGAKEFLSPKGIFVHNRIIFVADTGNARVQILGPNGVYLKVLGIRGGMPERLSGPESLVVKHSGWVYVIDTMDGWLKFYDVQGNYIGMISRMKEPVDITLAGSVYLVADSRDGSLQFLDSNGEGIGTLGPWGRGAKPFKSISGLVIVGDMVYASDYEGNDVKVFRAPGLGKYYKEEEKTLMPWVEYTGERKLPGIVPGKLERASDGRLYVLDNATGRVLRLDIETGTQSVGLEACFAVSFTIGPRGNIYCLDARKNKVFISSDSGNVSRELDLAGASGDEGNVVSPSDIGVSSSGDIYIADRGRGQISVFGVDGAYRGPLGLGGTKFYIKDPVALKVSGDIIYVADLISRKIFIFSSSGRLIRELWDISSLKSPAGLAVSKDYIYVLDAEMPDIKVFSKKGMNVMSFGSAGDGLGEFSDPASIGLDEDGNVLVSDTGNKRVQRLSISIEPEYEKTMWKEKAIKQHDVLKKRK